MGWRRSDLDQDSVNPFIAKIEALRLGGAAYLLDSIRNDPLPHYDDGDYPVQGNARSRAAYDAMVDYVNDSPNAEKAEERIVTVTNMALMESGRSPRYDAHGVTRKSAHRSKQQYVFSQA